MGMIVLTIPYHAADRRQAAELTRFIADLEPAFRHDIRIRLVARDDCEHLDPLDVNYLARRFDVSWAKVGKYEWRGWPAGPNGMAKEILETAPNWLRDCGWADAVGVMILEPDCVPLSKDWLNQLQAAWDLALLDGCWLMGSWRNSGPECGHINGNCIIDPRRAREIARHINQYTGWDCAVASYVKNHWCITGLIRNDFDSRNATEEVLRTPEVGAVAPVMSHGWKDGSGLAIARRWNLRAA